MPVGVVAALAAVTPVFFLCLIRLSATPTNRQAGTNDTDCLQRRRTGTNRNEPAGCVPLLTAPTRQ